MKKIGAGKIIFVIIVLFLLYSIVTSTKKEKTLYGEILDKVVVVNDAKLSSENEGKIVLVSGKIEYDNKVSFMELDENFGTIKITRKVEKYTKHYDQDENKYVYEWEEVTEPRNDANGDYLKTLVSDEKVANVKIGEFSVPKDKVPADETYIKQDKIGNLIQVGSGYTRNSEEEYLKVGDVRLTYKYYDLDKYPYMSILAVQNNDGFSPYINDGKEVFKVFKKQINSKEDLAKELDEQFNKSSKSKIIFLSVIVVIGGLLMYSSSKNSKKDNK